ncbi:NAD(P)-binding domain-containing protein [Amylibacter sp. IMCC11727]|uniref:NAD(P)-binding domain-containing protein n=1 Tax=Amylibacter sp. IMCC11727 TaxID=3039851 RepID=UPI00244DB59F|nr:NAD(P)-binding domain-containing protein [Amylibacter sp. IMCC11727]WGI20267.1 NAD(P)-binding domain-containing protein [Amylibacter sp. IMCC11727]
MARIGFIGTGEIAAAMVKGLAGQGHQIIVSERNADMARALAEEFEEVQVAPNQAVLDGTDTVWLCLMAHVAEDVLTDLTFREDHVVVSAMVDVSHGALQQLCAPAHNISMTIPMPFIALGGCPLPVFPSPEAVDAIFGARNIIIPVDSERNLNAYFGGSAQVAAVLAQMREGAVWLGEQTGDAAAAEAYIAAMFAGTMAEMPKDGNGRFDRALQALNTEGGLNTTVRGHLRETGSLRQLRVALDGLKGRLGLE